LIVVTGGAGFIGSNLIRELNQIGLDRILVVEDLSRAHLRNLDACRYLEVVGHREFLDRFADFGPIDLVFHQGACTDTMVTDRALMMAANYEYSCRLLELAVEGDVRLIYASSAAVYGDGSHGFAESSTGLQPLNLYAHSKLLFDQEAGSALAQSDSRIVGLRYFNVYGPRESFKGRMASVIYQFHLQARDRQSIHLFEGSEGYRRDFIYVGDVITVLLHFLRHPDLTGIYNVGTGTAVSFRTIAELASEFLGVEIEEIPFPESLRSRYQVLTRADSAALRMAGFSDHWTPVETAVPHYLEALAEADGGVA